LLFTVFIFILICFLIGYLFDYNESQLNDLSLEKLKLWPTDKQIIQTIHHSYQLAYKLIEFLNMIQPIHLPIDIKNSFIIIRSHEEEVSTSYTVHNEVNEVNNIQENSNDDDISFAINNVSKEIDRTSNLEDDDFINPFQNCQVQLNIIIDQFPGSLSVVNNGDSSKYLIII
jgi:two-component SAPR family response regulator